jgi:hypothetical protein
MRYEYADAIMLENVDTIYLLSFGKKEKSDIISWSIGKSARPSGPETFSSCIHDYPRCCLSPTQSLSRQVLGDMAAQALGG